MFGSQKMREKENWKEKWKEKKGKESNINFFTCLVIHEKFKGKKIILKKKWKENKFNNLSKMIINL